MEENVSGCFFLNTVYDNILNWAVKRLKHTNIKKTQKRTQKSTPAIFQEVYIFLQYEWSVRFIEWRRNAVIKQSKMTGEHKTYKSTGIEKNLRKENNITAVTLIQIKNE